MKDNWKKIPIGEVCKTYAGGTPNRSNSSYYGGSIPWVSSGEVNQSYITDTKEKITSDGLRFSSAKMIPKEAILLAMYGATAGQVSKLKIEASSNQAVLALIPEEADDYFIYHELNFIKNRILFLAQGSGQPNLSKSLIDKTLIDYPPLPQQKKIAKILSTVDTVIEQTQTAIAKYQAIKQGLMHDVFTRGIDVNTGQLRPKQQDAPELYKESALGWIPREWEVEELGENTTTYAGGTPNRSVERFYKGTIPWISSGEVNQDSILDTKEKITDEALKFSSAKMVPSNSILIALYGATAAQVSMLKIHACTNQAVLAIIPNSDWNRYFIYYGLNFSKERILFLAQGSGQPNLNKGLIDSTIFWKPNIKEQTLIAQKLQSIDQKIHTEQRALAKYQQLKAGLMQDLLTGKVEVRV